LINGIEQEFENASGVFGGLTDAGGALGKLGGAFSTWMKVGPTGLDRLVGLYEGLEDEWKNLRKIEDEASKEREKALKEVVKLDEASLKLGDKIADTLKKHARMEEDILDIGVEIDKLQTEATLALENDELSNHENYLKKIVALEKKRKRMIEDAQDTLSGTSKIEKEILEMAVEMDRLQNQVGLSEEESVERNKQLAELSEQMATYKKEINRQEDIIGGLEKVKQEMAFLEQQRELLDYIDKHDLDRSKVLSGIQLGRYADAESLTVAMTEAMKQVANKMHLELIGESGWHGFAAGGSFSSHTPMLVGERGPEIIVPNTSGQVIPNNEIGGVGETNNFYITSPLRPENALTPTQTVKRLSMLYGVN
jgi:hypothetical protein